MPDDPTLDEAVEEKQKFSEWLAEHQQGVLDVDLAEAFMDVVERVARSGKAGKVQLTLTVSKEGDMLGVIADVVSKPPKIPEMRVYWRGLDGKLTREHPLQPRLPEPTD